jgi:hypothetical protein
MCTHKSDSIIKVHKVSLLRCECDVVISALRPRRYPRFRMQVTLEFSAPIRGEHHDYMHNVLSLLRLRGAQRAS